eukprot:Nk52_evm57s1810 gene=Nk52_evmTU57s1810
MLEAHRGRLEAVINIIYGALPHSLLNAKTGHSPVCDELLFLLKESSDVHKEFDRESIVDLAKRLYSVKRNRMDIEEARYVSAYVDTFSVVVEVILLTKLSFHLRDMLLGLGNKITNYEMYWHGESKWMLSHAFVSLPLFGYRSLHNWYFNRASYENSHEKFSNSAGAGEYRKEVLSSKAESPLLSVVFGKYITDCRQSVVAHVDSLKRLKLEIVVLAARMSQVYSLIESSPNLLKLSLKVQNADSLGDVGTMKKNIDLGNVAEFLDAMTDISTKCGLAVKDAVTKALVIARSLGRISPDRSGSIDALSKDESDLFELSEVLGCVGTIESELKHLAEMHRPPNVVCRKWPYFLCVFFIGKATVSSLVVNKDNIKTWFVEGILTLKAFVQKYVFETASNMYKTVRYDESEFSLVGAGTLRSDQESLERMVAQLIQDEYITNREALFSTEKSSGMNVGDYGGLDVNSYVKLASEQVKAGDLSSVMRFYEEGIRKPIQGFLFGNLLRTVLIQVQHQKVEVGRALSVLDKLMRSNAMNFYMLTAIPSLVGLLFASRFVYRLLLYVIYPEINLNAKSWEKIRKEMRQLEIEVDKLVHFLKEESDKGHWNTSVLEVEGNILLGTYRLLCLSRSFATKEYVELFQEDILMIEKYSASPEVRKNILSRMHRTYPFL